MIHEAFAGHAKPDMGVGPDGLHILPIHKDMDAFKAALLQHTQDMNDHLLCQSPILKGRRDGQPRVFAAGLQRDQQ